MDRPSKLQDEYIQDTLREIEIGGQLLSKGQDGARTELITKARSLIAALETPIETIIWMAWAEVCR